MNLITRNLIVMGLLLVCTLGIYELYWIVKTKLELNKAGAHIPTAWLIIIPLINIYFLYKFAEGFCQVVLHDKTRTVTYFILIFLLPFIGALIYQSDINTKEHVANF